MPSSFRETTDEDTHILKALQDFNLYEICKQFAKFIIV